MPPRQVQGRRKRRNTRLHESSKKLTAVVGYWILSASLQPSQGARSPVQLTTRGRYAVTAMLDLALHAGDGTLRLADIAERQGISLSYLEQLFARLRRDGLVASVRGPGGGYRLGLPGEQLSIGQIIDAVNERLDVTRCGGQGDCQQGDTCLTHHLWTELSDNLHGFLHRITIADLLRDHAARAASSGPTEGPP